MYQRRHVRGVIFRMFGSYSLTLCVLMITSACPLKHTSKRVRICGYSLRFTNRSPFKILFDGHHAVLTSVEIMTVQLVKLKELQYAGILPVIAPAWPFNDHQSTEFEAFLSNDFEVFPQLCEQQSMPHDTKSAAGIFMHIEFVPWAPPGAGNTTPKEAFARGSFD